MMIALEREAGRRGVLVAHMIREAVAEYVVRVRAEASVIAVCERLGEQKVPTLDRGHFSILEPRQVKRLEILPA